MSYLVYVIVSYYLIDLNRLSCIGCMYISIVVKKCKIFMRDPRSKSFSIFDPFDAFKSDVPDVHRQASTLC